MFLDTGRWTINFICEHPFSSIVACVERKLVEHSLKDVEVIAKPISEEIMNDRKRRQTEEIRIGSEVITLLRA